MQLSAVYERISSFCEKLQDSFVASAPQIKKITATALAAIGLTFGALSLIYATGVLVPSYAILTASILSSILTSTLELIPAALLAGGSAAALLASQYLCPEIISSCPFLK